MQLTIVGADGVSAQHCSYANKKGSGFVEIATKVRYFDQYCSR